MEEPGTIVVGTDGSETAERAVDRAGALARALGVTVLLRRRPVAVEQAAQSCGVARVRWAPAPGPAFAAMPTKSRLRLIPTVRSHARTES